VIVPLLAFYANGYRYDFFADSPTVTVTGGLYIATQAEESEIYVNNAPVENTRFFRQATYIQGIEAGMHQVHVQGEQLQTWIKELPVYEQIVTEAAAFTLPSVPQVRPVTPYLTEDDEPVFLGYTASSSLPFSFASSTVSVTYSSSTATTTWRTNPEYTFLETVFEERSRPMYPKPDVPRFRFATTAPPVTATTSATSTVERDGIYLVRRDDDVYAQYRGSLRTIPYYYCVPDDSAASTTAQYGAHVTESLRTHQVASSSVAFERGTWFDQVCRAEIRLDRKRQTVRWYDFAPDSSDNVLLQLDDGVYMTEIDDRSWQNHQTLYPRSDGVSVLVSGGQVFVKDGPYFAEVFLELQ
jgi:hypothetical protein